jgi:hypothetical protein
MYRLFVVVLLAIGCGGLNIDLVDPCGGYCIDICIRTIECVDYDDSYVDLCAYYCMELVDDIEEFCGEEFDRIVRCEKRNIVDLDASCEDFVAHVETDPFEVECGDPD